MRRSQLYGTVAAASLTAAVLLTPATAAAHNAGCVPTPRGAVEVGSNKDSPYVDGHAPSQLEPGTGQYFLDLIIGAGDQYGHGTRPTKVARPCAHQGSVQRTRHEARSGALPHLRRGSALALGVVSLVAVLAGLPVRRPPRRTAGLTPSTWTRPRSPSSRLSGCRTSPTTSPRR